MTAVRAPGDKSISHRALILAVLAHAESRIRGLPLSRDVASTAAALRGLGAVLPDLGPGELRVKGAARLDSPPDPIDCGNSGTTARLLTGVLAGLGIGATLDGDASLRTRPMDRVVYPLQAMGARIDYLCVGGRLPIRLHRRATGALRPLRHRPRVASAQVKSSLLLAGLTGRVRVEVIEPGSSRDHTERLLRAMGAPIRVADPSPDAGGATIGFDPEGWDGRLAPLDLDVPGDPSAAAFLVGAALLGGGAIEVPGIALNPTRLGFLEPLRWMGAEVDVRESGASARAAEPIGELRVHMRGRARPFEIGGSLIPRVIDEIPMLAVLAARADGRSVIRDAAELRVKESDRLERLARNLEALGVRCVERPDGLEVEGTADELEGRVETGGDHRIAMAFGMLRADPRARVSLDDPGCVAVSYPGFWHDLERIAR